MSTLSQRSFAGGELAPALYARADAAKYQSGARTLRNHLVMRHGGATSRPGSLFVGEVRYSDLGVRLIKFVFNADQTYVLEFGDNYMRVIHNGAYVVVNVKSITGISAANPGVVTSAAHGYSNGDELYIAGVQGLTGFNGYNYRVANATANTYTLTYLDGTPVNTTSMGAYTSGGTTYEIYTIYSPFEQYALRTVKYVQSADVITFTHPDVQPYELRRTNHDAWTFTPITFTPSISAPNSVSIGGPAGTVYNEYVVTAVNSDTGEESLGSSPVGANKAAPTTSAPVTIDWPDVAGATEYNVYKGANGVYGFIGVAGVSGFSDTGLTPDTTDTPPRSVNPFVGDGNFPSTVAYIQQRLMFGNTDNDPEKVWGSRTGRFKNFTTSSPLQADDAVSFTLAGRQVNSIRHLLDLGNLLVFTASGEWGILGDEAGIIRPTDINPKQYTYNGASELSPLVLNGTALYVQARGSAVRDLGFEASADGYRGSDLTIFSAHMFDGFELVAWDYQQIPHSVVWVVRDDGVLLGLTYVREHEVWAWHRHDFGGTFDEDGVYQGPSYVEDVCAIPEGREDTLYVVVRREIDGRTVRYIERLSTRQVDDIKDYVGMDSALKYDGRNTDPDLTMTLSGGTTWDYLETVTLTASASTFTSGDVGNSIHLTGSDGTLIRFTITSYTSGTVVAGKPNKTIPVAMRSVAMSEWARAVDVLSGLQHLEGQQVSVLGDGMVIASPHNPSYQTVTVTGGQITLDTTYSVIIAGLPFVSDIETLDVESVQAETLADKKMIVSQVTVWVDKSRGIWAGPNAPEGNALTGMDELKIRATEGYDEPIALATGKVTVKFDSSWNSNGRVFIRQVDPVPLTVLAVAPKGMYPFTGGG